MPTYQAPIQNVNLINLTTSRSFTNLNTISILNSSADALEIINVDAGGTSIFLSQGESVTLSASTGFVLPEIELNSAGTIDCQVITT